MLMTAFPFVSVILPTYQREEVLCQTVTQLLAQDYPSYEIIIIDQTEKHNDKTDNFLSSLDKRVKYYHIERPSLPAARNFGLTQDQGRYHSFP